MGEKEDSAAFRIKKGGNISLKETKLTGFTSVVDAETVENLSAYRVVAERVKKASWWVTVTIVVIIPIIIGVVVELIMHSIST